LGSGALGYSRLGLGGLGFEVGEGKCQRSQAGNAYWEQVVHGLVLTSFPLSYFFKRVFINMNTTQLFVELLVIGSGAAVAFLILLISSQTINISFISSLISLIPIIAVIYILGILTDRISRSLFCPLENYIERIQKHKNSQDFEIIKCQIISKSEHYKAEIVYNRSRVRVCRGWVINFLLIGFSLAKSGFNKLR
jgi:amino acid transporter